MKKLTIKEIADACGGKFVGEQEILHSAVSGIETDSRNLKAGNLFIPIVGDIYDGHDFIEKAFENGAICTLSEKQVLDKPYLKVESTFQALKDIAEYYRSLFDVKVVAVTGSVGKTTTKEMIYSVLSQKYEVLKSQKNYNNEIGVPHTLFELEESHEVAVIEMGMNHFGEISRLSKTARPDICVITNIGHSHVGYLESREGIFRAKTEIFDFMKENGVAFLNGDDDLLYTLKSGEFDTSFYGFKEHNDILAKSFEAVGFESSNCVLKTMNESTEIEILSPGRHMVYAAAAAYAVGRYLGLTNLEIKKGIKEFKAVGNRMEIIKTDSLTILNDVYNASPESVKAAVDVLCIAKGRKVCILGDMFELGESAKELHEEVGEYAASKDVDVLVCAGNLSKNIAEGAKQNKAKVYWFETQADMIEKISNIINDCDTVLVKASRGMHFEETVEVLEKI